jgi:hypothetical protein
MTSNMGELLLGCCHAIRDYGCGYNHDNKDLLQQSNHPNTDDSGVHDASLPCLDKLC